MKKLSVSKQKTKTWNAFSQYIRQRDCLGTTGDPDYGVCYTCYMPFPFSKLQAGHFVPGRHNANLFSEKGTHAQCFMCNCRRGGEQYEYGEHLKNQYDENTPDELREIDKQTKKFTTEELKELEVYYKLKLEELDR